MYTYLCFREFSVIVFTKNKLFIYKKTRNKSWPWSYKEYKESV